jgi:ATP-binding cassette subfamily B protein
LIVAMLGLAPAFLTPSTAPASLAVGLGGVLLAFGALRNLSTGLTHLTRASISWETAAPLFAAAARRRPPGVPGLSPGRSEAGSTAPGQPILAAHDLTYRYPNRHEPALRGCDLEIRAGDRLLLEGPSGGGKSTLVSLLTGLRRPEGGLLLYRGLDRETLGDHAWRHAIVAAPQFHENHVLTGTFGFNLAMGRSWPPTASELEEAEAICRELGLGDLLDRMPAGMFQMVGESGWQLSHGERSRLFIARALVQGAEIILLDESFGALDPENLDRALDCVLRRTKTLMVIAHP